MNSILLVIVLLPAEQYMIRGDFDVALRYYDINSALNPSYRVLYGKAICNLVKGKFEESKQIFKAQPEKNAGIHYYLGVACYHLEEYQEAADHFDRAYFLNQDIWQALYYRGLLYMKSDHIEDAMLCFSAIPETYNKKWLIEYIDNYTDLAVARAYYQDDLYGEAIELYKELNYFFGYREIGLALAFAKTEDFETSLTLLDSVINYSSDRKLIIQSLSIAAQFCLRIQQIDRSRQYLRGFFDLASDDHMFFLMGKTYSDELIYDSAFVYFKQLPDTIDDYLFYKGRTNYFLGNWGRSEEMLLRHNELFPNSIYSDRTIFILASINYKRKEYDYALEFWNELVAIYPESRYAPAAQKNIGLVYVDEGNYEKALEAFRRVKGLNPSVNILEETQLRIYETLYKLRKFPSLASALRKFIEDNPNSRLVLKTRMRIAKILFEDEKYYQSLAELDWIIEQYPDSALSNKANFEKTRVYQALGNTKKLKELLKKLLVNDKALAYHSFAAHELGNLYHNEGLFDSSLTFFNMLLGNPQYREKALLEIARIYDKLGQSQESNAVVDQLISEFPASVFLFDAYLLKTKAYKSQGEFGKAINLLNTLRKKLGEKPEIYMEIGHIYLEIKNHFEARKYYLLACRHFKQKRDEAARALIFAGDASIAIGDVKSARDYYLQANLIAESIVLKNETTAKLSAVSEQ